MFICISGQAVGLHHISGLLNVYNFRIGLREYNSISMNVNVAELVLNAGRIFTDHLNNIKINADNYLQLIYFVLLFFYSK